jgi:hypothetical protein
VSATPGSHPLSIRLAGEGEQPREIKAQGPVEVRASGS